MNINTFSAMSENNKISIIVNSTIFIIIAIISLISLYRMKNYSKGYKILFIFYLIFWIPIFLGRDFRSKMNTAIDNSLSLEQGQLFIDTTITTFVMIGYGLVGIFARVFADLFSWLFKYRKAFLYLAILVNIITFIPIIVIQNHATNIIQVIGVGISASCIGTVELMFKTQYGKSKSFLTVSILSVPPLLANFLTAPIQSIISTLATYETMDWNGTISKFINPSIMSYLWVVGLAFLILSLVLVFFIKENRIYTNINNLEVDRTPYYLRKKINVNAILFFVIVSLMGACVTFIKFSNSGAIALNHLQVLSNKSSASYEGYLSVVFSLAQLIAGVLVGTILIKKMNVLSIFAFGSGTWILYLVLTIFIKNPIAYFSIHSLNGFAYGITYNLLLALVLSISVNTKVITHMGIYQSILSIGIMSSGWFNSWMKEILPIINKQNFNTDVYFKNNAIVNLTLVSIILILVIIFSIMCLVINRKNKMFYMKNLATKNNLFSSRI